MDLTQIRMRTAALAVYRNLRNDTGIAALIGLTEETDPVKAAGLWADYYAALSGRGYPDDSRGYMLDAARHDENPFSRAAAAGKSTAPYRKTAAAELETLSLLGGISPADLFPRLGGDAAFLPVWFCGAEKDFSVEALEKSYGQNGYGVFADSVAYSWNESEKRFEAIRNVSMQSLDELKNYGDEKRVVVDNTLSFLERLPANNVLLYGDRGTGKSSTVHAILREFAPRGLRLVEVSKAAIPDFPKIMGRLSEFSFRFIVFLDDLTFIEGEDDYAELKAALEGSCAKSDNVLIYATTNRRHLLKESYSDRQGDDMHAADTVEEQLSLSDRFGLVVTFLNPDKKEFLSILQQILADRGLRVPTDRLALMAERYAMGKGGRSPRAARQLADRIQSRLARNLSPEDL